MRRGIFSIVLWLLFAAVLGTRGQAEETILLTMPLFFENRIPEDISEIEERVKELVYEKIGVDIQLVPLLRIADSDERRNKELLLKEREGIRFDLIHGSMKGFELLELSDLLKNYGEGILELFDQNGQRLLEGGEVFSIPSFSDYVHSQGIAMRKDILEKYGIEVSELKSFEELDQLFAYLAPLKPEMKMICGYSTGKGLLYRYGWENFEDTVFCVDSENNVVNRYATLEYGQRVRLIREWQEKGYLYEYSALQDIPASDLVRAGMLFSFVCAYKPGIDAEVSNSCGMEMAVVQTRPPVVTEQSITMGCYGISADCRYPKEAMELLNLLYTDGEAADLLANGIEGVHYRENPEGTIHSLYGDGEFLNDASWILPNQFLTKVREGDDPLLWAKLDAYNRSASQAPNLRFLFDASAVEKERQALNEIAERYAYGLETGLLDPDVYLDRMLGEMRKAGEEKVCRELASQYKSWCEAQEG